MTMHTAMTTQCRSCAKGFGGVQGNINLIEAAAKKGVKRFILLTSIGVGNSKDAPPQQVYDVLKPVLIEKGKAEERLKVRPALAVMHVRYLSAVLQVLHERYCHIRLWVVNHGGSCHCDRPR